MYLMSTMQAYGYCTLMYVMHTQQTIAVTKDLF